MTAIAAPPARSSIPVDQQESLANTYQRLMLMLLLFVGVTVLIVGRLFKHSVVAVGAAALDSIRHIHADVYLMGVTGVHTQTGLTTGDLEEAHIKRALMAQAAETWVLASSETLNAASHGVIAPCRAATGLVVERSVPKRLTGAFDKLGLSVRRA